MHYFKECPMLCICQNCDQVIELKDYEMHLKNECEKQELISLCGFCEFPVNKDQVQEHVSKFCKKEKPKINHLRCPLCLV